MWTITCGECGATAPTDQWMETLMGTKLPAGQVQCPECKVAINRVSEAPTVFEAGNGKTMIIPGDVHLERVPSYL